MKTGYQSQEKKILAALEKANGAFVSLPRLVEVSGSYNISKRISNLNNPVKIIENDTLPDPAGGFKKFSFYRLIKPTQNPVSRVRANLKNKEIRRSILKHCRASIPENQP